MATFNPNLFTQWFEKPKVSVFDRRTEKSADVNIGPLYPFNWELLSFGDSAKGHSLHKMRLMPMLAPNFSDMRLEEHVGIIPLRVLMKNYETTFNYAKNREGAALPTISLEDLLKIYELMGKAGFSPVGSLFDFLGYPVFADAFKAVNSALPGATYDLGESTLPWSFLPGFISIGMQPKLDIEVEYRDYSGTFNVEPFYVWLIDRGENTPLSDAEVTYYNNSMLEDDFDLSRYGFETYTSAYDGYLNYVFTQYLYQVLVNRVYQAVPQNPKSYTLLPLMAYHRFVGDWNLNSLVTDPEVYINDHVFNLPNKIAQLVQIDSISPSVVNDYFMPARRLWDNDYFTSLLTTASASEELAIPANSTIIDLAKLAAWQKFILRLGFSNRYRDVVRNIFGITPSDARLQQSGILLSKRWNIGIGETLQTSETTTSSVLGNFGGRGYSSGSRQSFHVLVEEPCIVLSFASFVANAVYADATHPLINVDDILDFPLPETDVMGNQPIYTDAITGNPEDQDIPLGYARQYYPWLANFSTVHNHMKTTLDYWQLSRRFDSAPALNREFLTINDKDDLDNIFSVPESSHASLTILYLNKVTRPVHRTVRIKI